ncbi:hypothetical protein ICM05_05335 [Leucobacter sp. cx-42]|uniref:hypothetical protein n=1 Tax=unclassified Leucobacter TaxID=2621730 RepID=UPI00165DAFBE|nr:MULTISPECIES: hypothetical protein [unclassified Leucobacter]MBC9954069.1 hypothetical protein [Leucobacter sp. cx-42]
MTVTALTTENLSLSLAQAATATGFSEGRFRYNRTRLEQLGVEITSSGWSIPVVVLIQLGWLSAEKVSTLELSPLQKAEQAVEALKLEVEKLKAQLQEERTQKRGGLFARRR